MTDRKTKNLIKSHTMPKFIFIVNCHSRCRKINITRSRIYSNFTSNITTDIIFDWEWEIIPSSWNAIINSKYVNCNCQILRFVNETWTVDCDYLDNCFISKCSKKLAVIIEAETFFSTWLNISESIKGKANTLPFWVSSISFDSI